MTILTLLSVVLVIWALITTSALKSRIGALEKQVKALRAGQAPAVALASLLIAEAPAAIDRPLAVALTPVLEPARRQATAPPAAPDELVQNLEKFGRWLINRWVIAAGGLTASLGGLFIVRYSIEQGLLGPAARILLAGLTGLMLAGAAEWVRHRPGDEAAATARSHVSAALSAAGWVTLYGDIYAAHAFYDLVPTALTFILLALVAFGALAAGLLYGPLAAGLGTGLGLLAPALVASDNPDATILFSYLFIVTAGVFVLLRFRSWPWLATIALGGNAVWQLAWMLSVGGQPTVRVVHLIVLPVLSALLLLRSRWPAPKGPWWLWSWSEAPIPVWTVGATVLSSFGLLWFLAAGTGYGGEAAVGWGVGIALLMPLALWAPTQQPLVATVAVMTIGLVASWAVPRMMPEPRMPWFLHGPIVPAALTGYVTPVAIYAALFGTGGFAALWKTSQRGLWAGVSATVPLVLLAILYARLSGFSQSLPWAGIALAMALIALMATDRTARQGVGFASASGAYAAAVTGAIALGATMALHTAWLTVALSLELPVLAWVQHQIERRRAAVPGLRILAGILAGILAIRLFLNPYVAQYAGQMPILWNWMLYGYGVPSLAAWIAARRFASHTANPDWVQITLASASLAFGTALMTLELWHVAGGGGELFTANAPFRQFAAIGGGWLVLGFALLRLERTSPNPVLRWGWTIIGGIGVGWSLFGTLGEDNPLWNAWDVGTHPVLNLLLLAYGLPALVLGLGAIELTRQRRHSLSRAITALAILFAIATILLEIRQAFHGNRLDIGGVTEAETYSYSAGLLIVSLGLLGGSLRWPASDLRIGGSALLAITLGKAFLVDMDDLTGLWRAASFLGLGISLIGVGYAFQRLQRLTAPTAAS